MSIESALVKLLLDLEATNVELDERIANARSEIKDNKRLIKLLTNLSASRAVGGL